MPAVLKYIEAGWQGIQGVSMLHTLCAGAHLFGRGGQYGGGMGGVQITTTSGRSWAQASDLRLLDGLCPAARFVYLDPLTIDTRGPRGTRGNEPETLDRGDGASWKSAVLMNLL